MNPRHAAFLNAYLGEANGNGTKAAIIAGYSEHTASVQASQLLRHPGIHAALQKRLESADLSTDRTLQRIAKIANAQPAKGYQGSDVLKANELILKVNGALQDKRGDSRITVQIGFLTQEPPQAATVQVIDTTAEPAD